MAKATLNKASYVDAALDLIAESGVDKLSMRKVATRLGVSPMAMYKHFPAKEDLLTASFDTFIARANVIPTGDLPWDDWVEKVGHGMYRALCSQLSWVPLLGSLHLGSHAAMVTDAFVERLCEAGFTLEESLEAFYGVIQVVLGAVCLRASLDPAKASAGSVSEVTLEYLDNADRKRLSVAPALEDLLSREQVDIGLPLMIDALRMRLEKRKQPR